MDKKEIKEAIMFLENTIYVGIRGKNEILGYKVKYNHWIKKVIKLLEEGEKYKKMYEEELELNY